MSTSVGSRKNSFRPDRRGAGGESRKIEDLWDSLNRKASRTISTTYLAPAIQFLACTSCKNMRAMRCDQGKCPACKNALAVRIAREAARQHIACLRKETGNLRLRAVGTYKHFQDMRTSFCALCWTRESRYRTTSHLHCLRLWSIWVQGDGGY